MCVRLCALSPIGLNGRTYCKIAEKLRIFPYRQSLETSFYWLSDDIVRFKIEVGVEEKCTKM